MKLFDEVHKQGQTIIMVTHEEDVATCARRTVCVRDGLIESDLRTRP